MREKIQRKAKARKKVKKVTNKEATNMMRGGKTSGKIVVNPSEKVDKMKQVNFKLLLEGRNVSISSALQKKSLKKFVPEWKMLNTDFYVKVATITMSITIFANFASKYTRIKIMMRKT